MDPLILFDNFVQASTFTSIQQTFFQLCVALDVSPSDGTNIYKRLRLLYRGKTNSKAEKLFELLDKRSQQPVYGAQRACQRLNGLIVGAGPCGLRAAIECALLGAHVVVVEEREVFSRNNVLHLWDFVIQDLKALGAKIFYPKFCTGSIEHISIRRLQCILLKVALVLGAQVHSGVSFLDLAEPTSSNHGWKAHFEPSSHLLGEYEFDLIIGADGKKNSLPGFERQTVRGKLAIGITANFVNTKTSAEEKVQEISGVAYVFNQSFFKDMRRSTGIDLENIVYYKDETHYFVMCAKKTSLLQKGVIKRDHEDIPSLLANENVDQAKLCDYACRAADFATNFRLPQLVYAKNARGTPDMAMFDFTALSSARYSTRLLERHGRTLIMAIVGDSLHEPFWPTGSGCARGFLSVLDTAWMLRSFGGAQPPKSQNEPSGPMEILAQRESIYKLLAQTTKENLCKWPAQFTIDPRTRYKFVPEAFGAESVDLGQLADLVDTDNPRLLPTDEPLALRLQSGEPNLSANYARKYSLWRFCHFVLQPFRLPMVDFSSKSWGDMRALSALIGRFRPDLVDYVSLVAAENTAQMFETTFRAVEQAFGVLRPCKLVTEWIRMPEEVRLNFLFSLVERILDERGLVQKLLPSPAAITRRANLGTTQGEPITQGKVVQISTGAITPGERASAAVCAAQKSSVVFTRAQGRLNPDLVSKIQSLVSGDGTRDQRKQLFDARQSAAAASKDQQ